MTDPALLAALEECGWRKRYPNSEAVRECFTAGWRARERHREGDALPLDQVLVAAKAALADYDEHRKWSERESMEHLRAAVLAAIAKVRVEVYSVVVEEGAST